MGHLRQDCNREADVLCWQDGEEEVEPGLCSAEAGEERIEAERVRSVGEEGAAGEGRLMDGEDSGVEVEE